MAMIFGSRAALGFYRAEKERGTVMDKISAQEIQYKIVLDMIARGNRSKDFLNGYIVPLWENDLIDTNQKLKLQVLTS